MFVIGDNKTEVKEVVNVVARGKEIRWNSLDHIVELKDNRIQSFPILNTGEIWEVRRGKNNQQKRTDTHFIFFLSKEIGKVLWEEKKWGQKEVVTNEL